MALACIESLGTVRKKRSRSGRSSRLSADAVGEHATTPLRDDARERAGRDRRRRRADDRVGVVLDQTLRGGCSGLRPCRLRRSSTSSYTAVEHAAAGVDLLDGGVDAVQDRVAEQAGGGRKHHPDRQLAVARRRARSGRAGRGSRLIGIGVGAARTCRDRDGDRRAPTRCCAAPAVSGSRRVTLEDTHHGGAPGTARFRQRC